VRTTTDDFVTSAASEKEVRAARLAHVLARAVRDGEVHAVDARRVIVHELRKLNTNKTLTLPARSVAAQRVIERYAERAQPIPKNGSDDALHADHVYKFTAETLITTDTVERWLQELRRLAMVVCVTARENYILEGIEAAGTIGPPKYAAAGITFTGSAVPWADPGAR
jgi:hypothetical protein